MSNQVSPEEGHKSNSNSSSGKAVTAAANSLEETEFTCHIYDGSEGAIKLPEPKAKPAPRRQTVVDGSRDNSSSVNSVASFFSRIRVSLKGSSIFIKVLIHFFETNLELFNVRHSETTYSRHTYITNYLLIQSGLK